MNHGGNIFAFARERGWDWRDVADFSASINPLGPSPAIRHALMAAMDRIVHYPESEPAALRETLAALWRIDADRLIVGNGATELIHFFARTIGESMVSFAAPVFGEFHRAFPAAAIVPFDPAGWPTQGLIAVTRPANPTGAMPDGLEDYLAHTTNPVIVDESFIEFTREPSLLTRERPNLFVLRSLTKFHALPGLRIGALAGPPDTMRAWRERREPWQVNVLAEAAVLAAIKHEEHARATVEFVESERRWLSAGLASIAGLHPQPSAANYILVAADRPIAPISACLAEQKILIRDCSGWPGVPFAHAMRIAVRCREDNVCLISALRGIQCD